ncbi:MAG: hypothetical protein HRT42_01360 [Campylobacteraceae bacterium]|nr:hypothetical protein [Campylobacteraceae bacterium]
MIKINIFDNEIKDSLATKDLSNYLNQKGHNTIINRKSIDGAKADLAISIAIAALAYPIVKDLMNWVRPKRYTISITDGNITGSINELTESEFTEIMEKYDKPITRIEIN